MKARGDRRLWRALGLWAGTITLAGWALGAPAHTAPAWSAPIETVAFPSEPSAASTEPSPTPDDTPIVIGTSVGGRPLEVYRFGNGPRELLIVAGIHGGYEWNTVLLADALVAHVRDGSVAVPEDASLFILHDLNPDGYERAHGAEGRANDRGVDLNRNWPLNWQPDWNRSGCWDYLPITAGKHPLSEPETAALLGFIVQHDFQALISYHSAALGIFPGGQPPTEGSLRLAEAIHGVTDYPYPPQRNGCEYTGQFADWATAQGMAAVDVELSTHDSIDLWVNLDVLRTFLAFQP
ncbi:MAG TPA: M14 family metallopeptidase [Anaerolineales bacterium]|nr:M14 family metallopeptidase [Anaerolineales bacterium]